MKMATNWQEAIAARLLQLAESQEKLIWSQPYPTGGFRKLNGYIYNGVNQLHCWLDALEHGYTCPVMITASELKDKGINFKGKKSVAILRYVQINTKKEKINDAGDAVEEKGHFMRLVYAGNAFNCQQFEELAEFHAPVAVEGTVNDRAAAILSGQPTPAPTMTSLPGGAYYLPQTDEINIPPFADYLRNHAEPEATEFRWNSMFHELTHSTGHASRLARKTLMAYHADRDNHSKEEVIACFGAAMLCGECGFTVPEKNNAAYLQNWLKDLKQNPAWIVEGIQRAMQAVNFLLQRSNDSKEEAQA
jgi:antirestriction protein ArdC